MQIAPWIELALYALAGFLAGGLTAWLITHGVLSRRLRAARQALEAQHEKFLDASNALASANARLEEIGGLKNTLSSREDEIRDLQQAAAQYQRRIAELETILEKERAAASEKSAMIEEVKSRMADSFEAMAARALSENNQSFLELAGTKFSGYLESAKQELKTREKAVNEVVQPIADKLEKYDQEVRSMERVREKAYGELSQQVVSLVQTQSELQRETGKLVNALRMPHVRGRWGRSPCGGWLKSRACRTGAIFLNRCPARPAAEGFGRTW